MKVALKLIQLTRLCGTGGRLVDIRFLYGAIQFRHFFDKISKSHFLIIPKFHKMSKFFIPGLKTAFNLPHNRLELQS